MINVLTLLLKVMKRKKPKSKDIEWARMNMNDRAMTTFERVLVDGGRD